MKKILLICPRFHDYENELILALQAKGFDVYSILYREKEILKISIFIKAVLEILKITPISSSRLKLIRQKIYYKSCKKFFDEEMESIKGTYFKRLLVIKGYGLSSEHINKINSQYKVLYQWDIIERFPIVLSIYKYFDKVYTFDMQDSLKGYGAYLPSFYIEAEASSSAKEVVYDLFFIGIYTKKRYKILKEIIQKSEELGLSHCIRLVKSKGVICSLSKNNILTKSVTPRKDYETLFNKSKVVIEIPYDGQEGSTQRVLEAVNQNKLIITSNTNQNIQTSAITSVESFLSMSKEKYDAFIGTVSKNGDNIEEFKIENWLDIILASESD